jgi:hypothetical protein
MICLLSSSRTRDVQIVCSYGHEADGGSALLMGRVRQRFRGASAGLERTIGRSAARNQLASQSMHPAALGPVDFAQACE